MLPPSKQPGRIEVVMVTAQYKGQLSTMQVGNMQRDDKGKLIRIVHEEQEDMRADGRFANLLDDETDKGEDIWSAVKRRLNGH